MKKRIITHMNADHRDSLRLFLEHYNKVPSKLAADARLEDVELGHLILQSKAGRLYIPLDPPMKSWSEARERMVQMHHTALKSLDRSDIVVTKFLPPATPVQVMIFAAVCASFAAFSRRANFTKDSMLDQLVLHQYPGFERFCFTLQPYVIVFMVGLHSIEAVFMERTRLRKYNVERGSTLWWKWMVSCFLEGLFSFKRFDSLVKTEEDKKVSH